jgi:hypothetical protein
MLFNTNLESYKQEDSSVSTNPLIRWAKFILTDDKPNGNGKAISKNEFSNLVNTGVHQPIKMATGVIKDGHEDSFPIGVITNLTIEDDKIVGLAALWSEERPEDVEYIKEKFDNGEPLNLSWEVKYTESEFVGAVEYLKNVALRAATLVGRPAYQGRTPILAVASANTEENKLEDKSSELESKNKEIEASLAESASKLEALQKEVEDLRAYKQAIEQEKKDSEMLASIKEKFASAGIQKEDQYFAENKQKLLGMSEDVFAFMLQELVAFSNFAKQSALETSSLKNPGAPQVIAPPREDKLTPKELGRKLREMQSK